MQSKKEQDKIQNRYTSMARYLSLTTSSVRRLCLIRRASWCQTLHCSHRSLLSAGEPLVVLRTGRAKAAGQGGTWYGNSGPVLRREPCPLDLPRREGD